MKTTNIKLTINDGIATLTFDLINEKVNKLSFEVLKELDGILDEISNDSSLKLLLLTSNKEKIFIAGADINQIKDQTSSTEVYEKLLEVDSIFRKLENLKIPTVAIIDGACMGGGLELALCCDYRLAVDTSSTKIAFPEVKLGIFPGFGGTIRAPKIIGLINSLDLILSGKTIDAKKAYKIKLVNEYFPKGYKKFRIKEFINKVLSNNIKKAVHKNSLFENISILRAIIFKKAKENLEKKVHFEFENFYKALEVIEKTYNTLTHEKAIKIEAKEFSKVAVTNKAKNLIDIFFTSEDLKKEYKSEVQNPILSTAVIGSGVMGKGIIWLFSKYSKDVRVKLRKIEQMSDITSNINKLYSFYLKTRKMSKTEVEFKINRLSYTDNFEGFSLTNLALEAIIEDENEKKALYKNLENILNKDAIIATNTSSISIEKLSSDLENKERFIGIHFFNPVNKMPLVEIIKTSHTNDETLYKAFEFIRRCGKTPVLVGDGAGFLVNRVLLPYVNEAGHLLYEGYKIDNVDKTLKNFGMPMGPFMLADIVGIDIGVKVINILEKSFGDRMKISPILKTVHDDLNLRGEKTKKGFYIHNSKEKTINEDIYKYTKQLNKTDNNEIIERTIFIMINEASRCLEEGIIQKASYLDFAMIAGTGFPPFRGGILKYADSIGISYIVTKLEEYSKLYGDRFTPSNLLYKLKENNKTFYTGDQLWKL